MAKKKTTKKTATRKPKASKAPAEKTAATPASPAPPAPPAPPVEEPEKTFSVPPAPPPLPAAPFVSTPSGPRLVPRPPAPVVPYRHMGDRMLEAAAEGCVVSEALGTMTKREGELLLATLTGRAFVCVPQGCGWTPEDLERAGFDVAINGEGGKIFGKK